MAMPPPDPSPCWDGGWAPVAAAGELWLLAGLLRTVDALPRLHPWRLGDTKGSRRILRWTATRADDAHLRPAYAVLSEQAREPRLAAGDHAGAADPHLALICGTTQTLADVLVGAAAGVAAETGGRLLDASAGPATRWGGVVTRLPGSWLPPVAVLPRAARDVADPGTAWTTESAAFNDRHTVHSTDDRIAADLLAPHVMAILLDRIPDRAAVTLAGDAVHLWWEHEPPLRQVSGLASRMIDVVRAFADAIPSFVLADHPDRSDQVESQLDARQRAAREYRERRRLGASPDPVMQRIYDQARASLSEGDASPLG